MNIYPSKHFIKSFTKLPSSIQRLAIEKEKLFKADLFHPSLRTHRLKGKLAAFYAYRVNREYRIIFEIVNTSTVIYHDIGTHRIYQ